MAFSTRVPKILHPLKMLDRRLHTVYIRHLQQISLLRNTRSMQQIRPTNLREQVVQQIRKNANPKVIECPQVRTLGAVQFFIGHGSAYRCSLVSDDKSWWASSGVGRIMLCSDVDGEESVSSIRWLNLEKTSSSRGVRS